MIGATVCLVVGLLLAVTAGNYVDAGEYGNAATVSLVAIGNYAAAIGALIVTGYRK
jgi:hypothetical protein